MSIRNVPVLISRKRVAFWNARPRMERKPPEAIYNLCKAETPGLKCLFTQRGRNRMDFKDISPELREKAKACTSPEEVLELAKNEGYELSDEELADISGGLG